MRHKNHFYLEDSRFQHPNSKVTWFESACKLAASTTPSKSRSQITCLRCLTALSKLNKVAYPSNSDSPFLNLKRQTIITEI